MYILLALIFLLPSSGFAAENFEIEIKNLYSEMYRHMISKDISQLSKLLDDSFVLVHMTGMRQSKQEYLTAIANGTLNYFSEEPENVSIRIDGNKAFLVGQSRVNAAVFGGGQHTWRLELDIDLINKNGQWLMTEARASTY
ncbi:MAG: nuclear transport factor 2 family protein [Synergistaceae bacterium]|nr:nuclear transport factor 2 family protein [Synergistaceae bacterium]